MEHNEAELTETAKQYLKETYGEDTVKMTVKTNAVKNGKGSMNVDCTVSVDGSRSNWNKTFFFENGEVVKMNYRML
ncbi:MAG: hypothetical protein KKH91_01135 [Elusimicrobia bacterium]|nr:hypothetical protein [Elusimicrobiota bacterium]MBU2615366.1 hypothetical protein [Elusimicrobiota bacterium]